MWCSVSQFRSCHVVAECTKKPKERTTFVCVNVHAAIIILSHHKIENLKVIVKLSCVLWCPGKAESH